TAPTTLTDSSTHHPSIHSMEERGTGNLSSASHLLLLLLLFLLSAAEAEGAAFTAAEADAAISRFQEYLRIDTAHPNPDYAATAAFLRSQADSLSLQHETLEFVAGKPLILLKWPGRRPSLPSLLLNSHTDVVPAEPHKWVHAPFSAALGPEGNIYARGSQDMKCVGIQYLEAIRRLKAARFVPDRTIYISFVPDEEIGGTDGVGALVASDTFKQMRVGVVLDEGLASPRQEYRVFYGERCPWWLVIRAQGAPGHGAKLYDGSAMENVMKSVEAVRRFRAAQFDLVKTGTKVEGEVVSVNLVYLKAGTPSPTVSTVNSAYFDQFHFLNCDLLLASRYLMPQGFVMNLQPSEAEVGLDIRVPPNTDPKALEKRIAEEWAPSARNMTYEVCAK
ncbi:hypothetical protein BHM03_00057502, partial [Ensete ventricosum]